MRGVGSPPAGAPLTRRVAAPSAASWLHTRATTHSRCGCGALSASAKSLAVPHHARPSFLEWTQAHFPEGGPRSQLLETLEQCTRELLRTGRYKDDIRYLRVWVQYVRPCAPHGRPPLTHHAQADCCPEPKEIFEFLEVRRSLARSLASPLTPPAHSTTTSARDLRSSTRRAPRSWSCEATLRSRRRCTMLACSGAASLALHQCPHSSPPRTAAGARSR